MENFGVSISEVLTHVTQGVIKHAVSGFLEQI